MKGILLQKAEYTVGGVWGECDESGKPAPRLRDISEAPLNFWLQRPLIRGATVRIKKGFVLLIT